MIAVRAAARLRQRPSSSWSTLPRCSRRRQHDFAKSRFFRVSEEVRDAVATGKPVVALETTIYTHGFPYPDNVALASSLESIVRAHGGVPATIGILGGVAQVGMSAEQLIELASTAAEKSALKASRRDLGYICGLGMASKPLYGGTTISGTMLLAHLAGIKIFGTGGLGGVHRGGEVSMDISADLTELGRTPVTVISSGCKSFLDLPRTLEYLETEGVCVATFADGREGPVDFPAFYSRESGIKSPKVIKDEKEAAAIVYAQSKLPVSSGIHFANPVPLEHSIPRAEMDDIIEQALHLADIEGYHGSDNTPFVLAKIKELSGNKSVVANRALVENNVKRATKVAVELAKLEQLDSEIERRPTPAMPMIAPKREALEAQPPKTNDFVSEKIEKVDILVAGSLAIDLACDYAPLSRREGDITPVSQTSNPAVISQSLGGVGHNVALASKYAGSSVLFCSVVADDFSGRAALSALQKEELSPVGIQVLPDSAGSRTAQYIAVNDVKKDLVVAMADMSIMELPEDKFDFDDFWEPLIRDTRPQFIVVDANWSPAVISKWTSLAKKHNIQIVFEPVSTAKSCRLFSKRPGDGAAIGATNVVPENSVTIAAPNKFELSAMYTAAQESGLFESDDWWRVIDTLGMSSAGSRDRLVAMTNASLVDEGVPQQSIQLLPYLPCIVTKLGAQGVLLTRLLRAGDSALTSLESAPYILSRASTADGLIGGVYMRLFPPAEVLEEADIVSVNGAGDTLLGVLVAGLAGGSNQRPEDLIPAAQQASVLTLKSAGGVSRDIAVISTSK
ncbi:hypothetical protein ASPZODRAFT_28581 [Penicilliopsis zonata CBS 506.65]|uniref:Carbohydrate kinase PfkB domain-containing protein n=1 Tax=Penicilliopsis zonata CBS 506.65 TaxID=1073090 RepID=A0A1L9S821_9EURO|nr:hypothetical protein ASPZODRAFT_28581 [Penicilliopsis zonata CBS 506.65]OJJ43280.1 hypothetical protein ASPZODRAFT_28581 [Penicilliopsis zonata CBS 506.65]